MGGSAVTVTPVRKAEAPSTVPAACNAPVKEGLLLSSRIGKEPPTAPIKPHRGRHYIFSSVHLAALIPDRETFLEQRLRGQDGCQL